MAFDWSVLANPLQDIGYGLTQGNNIQSSLKAAGERTAQMAQPRAQAEIMQRQEQERQAAIKAQAQQANQTAQWLAQNGSPDLAEAMSMGAMDGQSAFKEHLARKQGGEPKGLMNAGDGNIYDPNTGQWIQAPGGSSMPESVVALQERAKLAGLQPGTPAFNEFIVSGGRPSGTLLSVGPDGTVSFQQGMAGGKPLTEAQSKDNVYSIRAQGVAPILDEVGTELTNFAAGAANADPTGLVRSWLQSPSYQRADQAGKEFLASVLRKDTGAAVTPTEFDMYGRIFLPMPGDGPDVIEQKKQARARAIRAINQGLPPAVVIMQSQAIGGDAAPSAGGRLRYNPATGELE